MVKEVVKRGKGMRSKHNNKVNHLIVTHQVARHERIVKRAPKQRLMLQGLTDRRNALFPLLVLLHYHRGSQQSSAQAALALGLFLAAPPSLLASALPPHASSFR